MTTLDAPTGDVVASDALTLGRRIRERRLALNLTLEQLASAVDRAPSQVSSIENGKREPRLPLLRALAQALGVSVDELLQSEAPSERAALEIAVERAQRGSVFTALGISPIRVSKTTSDETLKAVLALHSEVERLHRERAATPEEARRANTELRKEMRARNNYFLELEQEASTLLESVGYAGGPILQQTISDMAERHGFSLHYVSDLPHSTRSVIDKRNGRMYLGTHAVGSRDPRAPILQSLASIICGHTEPRNYAEFLRQRVEANYLAGAILLPEQESVRVLKDAKEQRQISMEDLRDAFGVSYETACHRFTNLATEHLDLPVHFMKVHDSGTLIKAYENDNVIFPSDALGAYEGTSVCRQWTARTVFAATDRFSPWYQYTDTPSGTFWCTSRVEKAKEGEYSVSVGVPFSLVKWFRGRETPHRSVSRCPDETCCRRAPSQLTQKWESVAWPEASTPTSLLAALPTGTFPGVDSTEVYEFLESHERRESN
jgi:predicted transcriptional regulator/transcriptional regulator with XRE-family HTH domain